MKQILSVIGEIVAFLDAAGWPERATWFRSLVEELQTSDDVHRGDLLVKLKRSLAGMGSLTDLPINDTRKLGMSATEARSLQFDLANRLGAAIDQYNRE